MSTYLTRFSARQRIEHALVMSLFIVLSVTGLPQKYFDAGWARWLIDLMGGIDRIRWFHRAAGLSFTAMTAFHLMFAIGAVASGRSPLSIVPNRKDFTDAIQTLRYYLGRADAPARFDRFDYRQKFEYWGLVLGAVVVICLLIQATVFPMSAASAIFASTGILPASSISTTTGIPGSSLSNLSPRSCSH